MRDHCEAIVRVFEQGRTGETYCVGGETESSNLTLVEKLCDLFDKLRGNASGSSRGLIEFVSDRPGHDFRYAMDITKIRNELDWSPSVDLETGLGQTVQWYLDNEVWIDAVLDDEHNSFQERWYTR